LGQVRVNIATEPCSTILKHTKQAIIS